MRAIGAGVRRACRWGAAALLIVASLDAGTASANEAIKAAVGASACTACHVAGFQGYDFLLPKIKAVYGARAIPPDASGSLGNASDPKIVRAIQVLLRLVPLTPLEACQADLAGGVLRRDRCDHACAPQGLSHGGLEERSAAPEEGCRLQGHERRGGRAQLPLRAVGPPMNVSPFGQPPNTTTVPTGTTEANR